MRKILSLIFCLAVFAFIANPVQAQTATCPSGILHCANLTWSASTSGGTPTGFSVYRSSVTGGCSSVAASSCTKLGSVTGNVLSFSDAPLSASTKYFWVVTAFNGQGESGPSNEVTATTLPDPTPTAPTGLTVVVK